MLESHLVGTLCQPVTMTCVTTNISRIRWILLQERVTSQVGLSLPTTQTVPYPIRHSWIGIGVTVTAVEYDDSDTGVFNVTTVLTTTLGRLVTRGTHTVLCGRDPDGVDSEPIIVSRLINLTGF